MEEDAGPHFRLAKLSYSPVFVWMRTQPRYWRRNKSKSGIMIELVAKLTHSRQAMLSGCSVQDLRYGHLVSVRKVAARSLDIDVGGTTYRRNQRHMRLFK